MSDFSNDEFEAIMRRYSDFVQSEDEDEDESQRFVEPVEAKEWPKFQPLSPGIRIGKNLSQKSFETRTLSSRQNLAEHFNPVPSP